MPFFLLCLLTLFLGTSLAPAQEPITPPIPASDDAQVAHDGQAERANPLILADQKSEPLLEIPAGFSSSSDLAAASALLQKIADAQFRSRKDELVNGIFLQLKLQDRQDGNASEIGFDLQYLLHPREIITLEIDDPDRGTKVQKGFDGRNYWLVEGDKDKLLMSGHEFGKDRESIDEAMELCADLMLMLDFRQLEKRNLLKAILSHENGQRILVGELRRDAGSKWRYHLWMAPGEFKPFRLELARRVPAPTQDSDSDSAPAAPAATLLEYQRFELLHYKAFEGRSIPQVIEIFTAPFASTADLPARILEIHRFDWVSDDNS